MILHLTLDDDLFGTRDADYQFESLIIGKADKEGHVTDSITDFYFQLFLEVRFRGLGKKQDLAAVTALKKFFEARGEVVHYSVMLTADRGYVCTSLMT